MMLSNVHAYPCVLHTVPLVRGKRRGSAHHSQRAVRSAIGFSPASRGRSTPLFIWLWWCPDVAGGQHTLTYHTPVVPYPIGPLCRGSPWDAGERGILYRCFLATRLLRSATASWSAWLPLATQAIRFCR